MTAAVGDGLPRFRRIGERDVHHGYVWKVVVAEFEAPDGTVFERDIVRSPGAVSVVPLEFEADGTAMVTLVRQWRPPYETELWEIPAGIRDVAGEPPQRTAERELAEEIGRRAAHYELLTRIAPSAAMTDSITWIYLGTGLSEVPRDVHGPEEEHMSIVRMTLDDAVRRLVAGEITDAKTVVGLLLADRKVREGTVPARR